ncbi:DUF1456 family protein [Bacteriovorax sp. PP10]|uniref:DUF1456 family protein n=1 Tax=Bacteriovorax antarcticus TaxID=3088717 RepID=A0ABU5VQ07_9BACT|nr:DUF1456 family protein [Bacteriovorax sp. PP10]MEA9355128.1 DUF1456 family protein [Bacteriovorax sp. PP10]
MTNNDYLRSIRFLLDVSDAKLVEIMKLADITVPLDEIKAYLLNEEDEGYIKCSDEVMAHFLDGLVYYKRGKDESRPPVPFELPLSNNVVLKKLRVAFALKEDDMHDVLKTAGFSVGRSELSALLRKKDHVNYRECGDQLLRNFLKGLTMKNRG